MPDKTLNIPDSLERAAAAKLYFKEDYQMYCDYCAQYRHAENEQGQTVCFRMIPISEAQYREIQPMDWIPVKRFL